ncbi:HDOD domain-containing protein [uncultured Sphaerotilus sp.]|uniref:HDOD domain-containing protein n=1 Tax=uncultured Sphaerotilus sp. TaxID=474984 RepID=UPI0030CA2D13
MTCPSSIAPFVQRASTLPAMPEVAHKLLKSFDRDDLPLPEIAGLIGRDQTLAAKVLRLANSSRYSPSHTVTSLNDASASLGMRVLRDLTLSASMVGAFPAIQGFDRLSFWRGTLAVAAYAQPIARALDLDEDMAYLGGLMLRTGQLLMWMVDPDHARQAGAQAQELDSRIGFETVQFGVAHPEITAELARHWQFPAVLVEAFRATSQPMEAKPFSRLAAVLRLASVVADCRESGRPVSEGLLSVQGDLVVHLGLDLGWLEEHLPAHDLAVAGVDALMH